MDTSGSERDWTDVDGGVWLLPNLVCESGTIPASDVEISLHMTGTQNGRVQYVDRNEDFDCGGDWATIQCCMTAVSQAEKWHEVGRIRADISDVADICNPLGDHDWAQDQAWVSWAQDQAWVSHVQSQQGMTQAEAQESLKLLRTDLHDLDASLPSTVANSRTTSCEKKLCMAITTGQATHNLMGVCGSINQQCI